MLAVTESWENGKPVRETLAADIPLAADHFRYFAAAIRTDTAVVDRDPDRVVAGHGCPPHRRIALA
jgi:aldehyde dehydrogenase